MTTATPIGGERAELPNQSQGMQAVAKQVEQRKSDSTAKPKKRLSFDERVARRKEIAMHVKHHQNPTATAMEFNVSITTVRNACLENGVRMKVYKSKEEQLETNRRRAKNAPVHPKTVRLIAELLKGEKTQSELASEYGVSRQWIHNVKKRIEGV